MIGRYYGNDPCSDEHFSAIQQWLDSCLTHPKCSKTASGATRFNAQNVSLPTRCIEITRKGFLLRETSGEQGSYVTLSHRWGEDTKRSKTTTSNYDLRKRGRGFDVLPQSFQDAILITRRLGIRYIWIDSVCIIQSGDEGADWRKEATEMAQYYQQSIMTISATETSQRKGILAPRSKGAFKSLLRLPYRDANNIQKGHFYVYKPYERSQSLYLEHIRDSELLSRGWVFQEWFLSRRIIYYTPHEIFFECQTEPPKSERQQIIHIDSRNNHETKKSFQLTPSSGFDSWYDIIESYSGTELTMPSEDHIIAVSGVAKEFGEMIKGITKAKGQVFLHYISGLWLQDVHHGLLWQTKGPYAKCCGCGAPSWSWASRLADVRWLKRSAQSQMGFEVTALISASGLPHTVDKLQKWPPSLHESSTTLDSAQPPQATENIFDVTNTIVSVLLKGRIQPVLIKNYLVADEDASNAQKKLGYDLLETLARETDVDTVPEDYDLWKADVNRERVSDWKLVCSPSTPTIAGGWALFESPGIQGQLGSYEGTIVLALHVSTRKGAAPGGRYFSFKMNHDVYDVLFLEPTGGRKYRRLGVGRIFERNIIQGFNEVEYQEIELV